LESVQARQEAAPAVAMIADRTAYSVNETLYELVSSL